PLAVRHETYTLQKFTARLPELKAGGESMMFYIFPFDNQITVEFRRYNPGAAGKPNRAPWPLRNLLWANAGPLFCARTERTIEDKEVRYAVIDNFCAVWRFKLENFVRGDNTVPGDQIIRYPPVADASRYTFSLSAFPEATYPFVLADYFEFCK